MVSIKIPEIMNYKEVIEVAENYDDFLNKIEKSLDSSDKKMIEKRIDFASRHSWEHRFDEIQNIISCHC